MGKKYRTERRRIDARRVHVVIHNQDAVEYYKKHPNGTYGRLLGPQRGTALRRPRPRREAGRLGGESPDRRCCRQGAQDRCRLPGRGGVQGRPGLGRVLGMAVQLGMAAQLLYVQERWEEEL